MEFDDFVQQFGKTININTVDFQNIQNTNWRTALKRSTLLPVEI